MKMQQGNTALATIKLDYGLNVRELPHRAQVLSVGARKADGVLLFIAGDRHSIRPDDARTFLVVNEDDELPGQEMHAMHYLGTAQFGVRFAHVFELNRTERPTRRTAPSVANIASGPISGMSIQAGSIAGALVRHGGGVHIQ